MSCLFCLRNEGLYFQDETTNHLQIFLGLFSLKPEFSQSLEDYKCCSLCRVKLQFVDVINQEISILKVKLKCFEKEVKEAFVGSFKENGEAEAEDELNAQARKKLLNELNLSSVGEFNDEQNPPIKVEPQDDFEDRDPNYTPHDFDPNFEPQDFEQSFHNSESETDFDSDEEKSKKKLRSTNINPKRTRRLNPKVSSKAERKKEIITCPICPIKTNFELNEDYEEHLNTSHPERRYSKCSICSRIFLEDQRSSEMKLKVHVKSHSSQKERSKRRSFDWKKFGTYKTLQEAKLQIKSENTWRCMQKYKTEDGMKLLYLCKYSVKCPMRLHLLIKNNCEEVSIYKTAQLHDHELRTFGLAIEIKAKIDDLFKSGIRKPKPVLAELREQGIHEICRIQVANYLSKLRKS